MEPHSITMALALTSMMAMPPQENADFHSPQAASPTAAQADDVNHWLIISAVAFSVCNAELIDVTGKAHIVESFRPDGSIAIHINTASLDGIGQSTGLTYNLVEIAREEFSTDPQPDLFITIHLRAITPGSARNDLLDITAHVFADADGNFQQEILDSRSACVG